MIGGRILTWTIGLLLFLNGSAWPISKDEMSLSRSTPNEEPDDVEIDKIVISADITVSQSRKQLQQPPPEVDDAWLSSGEVDDQPISRTDHLVVPFQTGSHAAHHNEGVAAVPTEPPDRPTEVPSTSAAPRHSDDQLRHGIDSAANANLAPDSAAAATVAESGSETTDRQPVQAKESKEEEAGDREDQESFEDETDSPLEHAREKLPTALQNLPRDIPNDRTISEILAENTIQDKQYNELRIEELLDELMAHTLGFGEVYSSDIE